MIFLSVLNCVPDGAGFGWNILLGSGGGRAKKRKAAAERGDGDGGEGKKRIKAVRFDEGSDDDGGGTADGEEQGCNLLDI